MPKGICYNANRQERRKCSLWHAKSPGVATSGAFLFRCGKVAYALGWLPPIYLRPAICRCSRRLHLPRQRVRKTKIYSWWHTPFLYLYRGGSVAHYTIVAEMPQEAYNTGTLVCPYLLERLFSCVYFHLCAQICEVLICHILHDFPKRQFISPPREDGRILAKCC